MDLSIIIPSYNTKKLLDECVASIYKSLNDTSISYEIIIVDNNSSDGSVELILKNYPEAIVIRSKTNLGYSKSNNKAANMAKGKYLLFLNSDIVVKEKAVEKLIRFVQNNSEVEIAGGKLFNKDNTPQPSAGYFYSLPVVFLMLFLRGDAWGATRCSPDEVRKADWISGACICIRKSVFNKIGKFDESIFMYMDEIDFLYRAKNMGYNAYIYPGSNFIHYGAASSYGKGRPVLNIYSGLIYFYKKHKMGYQLFLLQLMLLAKAGLAYIIGKIIGNGYLTDTYKKALSIVISPSRR